MRRFVTVGPSDHDQPFAAMNTTPLIDVLLVLLIMMIITIPAAMNEIPLNLPVAGGRAEQAVVHELGLARDGAVTLDGAAMNDGALSARLRRFATVGDVVTVRADPAAQYARFAETMALVKRAGVSRIGFARVETREF